MVDTVRTSRDGRRARRDRQWLGLALVATLAPLPAAVRAATTDPLFADVTPRSLAVAWAADQPVLDARVRLFADPDGAIELTAGLGQVLASATVPAALEHGVVLARVTGLTPGQCVYVQTETETAQGTEVAPAAPLPEVCTAAAIRRDTAADGPIANPLIRHQVLAPGESTPASGALVLFAVPDASAHPVAAFVGDGIAEPAALANLNDLSAAASGETLALAGGEPLELVELRGRHCPDFAEQRRERLRRIPARQEQPPIVELAAPAACFFADPDCSGRVEIADANRVFEVFGAVLGDCRYRPELDTVADDAIDILDVQRLLNRLGEIAP